MTKRFVKQVAFLLVLLTILAVMPVYCFADTIGVELIWKFPEAKWLQLEIAEGTYQLIYGSQKMELKPDAHIKLGQSSLLPFVIQNNRLFIYNEEKIELLPVHQGCSFRIRQPDQDWLSYRGSVTIEYQNNSWKLTNLLEAEDYLKGVVPIEMSNYWAASGMEALKAQAVAARTYLYRNLDTSRIITDSPNRHQAYMGKTMEGMASQAVEQTRGEIMVDIITEKPIDALYSSHNGGHTEVTEHVWSSHDPHYSARPDPFSQNIGGCVDEWSFLISAQRLGKEFGLTNVRKVILHKYPSGRVYRIDMVDWLGKETQVAGSDFLRKFYPYDKGVDCYSLLGKRFDINVLFPQTDQEDIQYTHVHEVYADNYSWNTDLSGPTIARTDSQQENIVTPQVFYLMKGSGWGHGVGMSQWGAYNMALQGYSYRDILFYYYNRVKIINKS